MSAICGNNRGNHMCRAFANQAPRPHAASRAATRAIKKGGGPGAFAIRDSCFGDAISVSPAATTVPSAIPSFVV